MEHLRKIIKKSILKTKYSEISSYLSEFEKTDWFDKVQIENYQVKKLRKLLAFASMHVPYYRRVFQERGLQVDDFQTVSDIKKLPLLTKEVLYKEKDAMFADMELDGIKENTTSGSTGTPIVFRKQKSCRDIESALMTRYKKNGGIGDDDYGMLIWGSHSLKSKDVMMERAKGWLMNESVYNSYDMSEAKVENLIAELKKGKVKFLRGYTSAVFYIAVIVNQKGLHFEIPFVSVTAEQLYDFQRKEIVRAFGGNLYDQYGCGECGSMAFECMAHNGLHQAFEHSIMEVLDEEGRNERSGKVVLTNLDNFAMPLIRYENGDLVTLAEKDCSCGRHSMLISRIDGRIYDVFEGKNGKKVHGGYLDEVLLKYDLLKQYGISQIRIVQKTSTLFECQYVANKEILQSDKEALEHEYKEALGNSVVLRFDRRDFIDCSGRGKRHFVVPLQQYQKNKALYD